MSHGDRNWIINEMKVGKPIGGCFMFQRLTALAAAAMALVATSCLAETPDEMSRAMPENLVHPYLYFSAEEIPELQERVRDDEVCKKIYARLLAEGEKLLSTEVEKIPPQEDRNPRYTGDWSFHKYIDRSSILTVEI